jgi:hydroxypyruvate reductase
MDKSGEWRASRVSRNGVADAFAILRAAIAAADPAERVRHALLAAPELKRADRVHVVAIGKAACRMTAAADDVLKARIASRIVIVPFGSTCAGALHAAHPVPDASSEAAARALVAAVDRTPPGALLLVLLSGGASALATLPATGITIADYGRCVALLQRAGADIGELNAVRKHIDLLKGGRLAVLAAPRTVLGLVLSDVVDDPVDVIASGPLAPDPTTFDQAIAVLSRRGVWHLCANSIRATLLRGAAGLDQETPKDAAALQHVRLEVIGGNGMARDGAAAAARRLGYRPLIVNPALTGEARAAAAWLAACARRWQTVLAPGEAPLCLVAGGETTVTVRGAGRGGRNQELVLAAALALENTPHIVIGAAATDGIDGNSEAAGAVADAASIAAARERRIDPDARLADNDSYGFFRAAGGLLVTGPTGTNVMDVQIALVQPAAVPESAARSRR